MFRRRPLLIALVALAVPTWAGAQLGRLGTPLRDGINGVVDDVNGLLPLDRLEQLSPLQAAQNLLAARTDRLNGFVRQHRDSVALDDHGDPAVRNVILITGASAKTLQAVSAAGYSVEQDAIEGLDIGFARITLSPGASLPGSIRQISKLAPDAEISADTLHFASGLAPIVAGAALAGTASASSNAAQLGLIDGGVAVHASLGGPIEQRGFAKGAPVASGHGTAVASLISGTGPIRGAAPGAPLLVADIFGKDPAGGNALAIARALGWMAAKHASVVTISLVGPQNPLLFSAIRQAHARGMQIVAAVGNDGPAAPPAFPASYPGVIAVTGVDGRNRALIEAGRAAHLDYAAPGADMGAANIAGGIMRVRGTSFAAPLVAGRLYRLSSIAALDHEAQDLGAKGMDRIFGRGLICSNCRNNY